MKTQTSETTMEPQTSVIMTAGDLLAHWQGHRALTRRVIEAFPEKELFNHSVGGMRPFGQLVTEMLGMATPGLKGIITRKWDRYAEDTAPTTKSDLLTRWDATTQFINENWNNIPEGRFQETDVAFGQWPGVVYTTMFYFIDNEIHHRGQGYVYLRSLGIEPPPFWERN